MNAHTPGPWKASKTNKGGWAAFTERNWFNVLDHTAPGINARANAIAQAAVPELIEALQALIPLVPRINCPYPDDPNHARNGQLPIAVLKAQSALAKATS